MGSRRTCESKRSFAGQEITRDQRPLIAARSGPSRLTFRLNELPSVRRDADAAGSVSSEIKSTRKTLIRGGLGGGEGGRAR